MFKTTKRLRKYWYLEEKYFFLITNNQTVARKNRFKNEHFKQKQKNFLVLTI